MAKVQETKLSESDKRKGLKKSPEFKTKWLMYRAILELRGTICKENIEMDEIYFKDFLIWIVELGIIDGVYVIWLMHLNLP